MENLPQWLDMGKIAGVSVIVLAIIQYIKVGIPEKYIKYVAILIGVAVSIASEMYIGKEVIWIKAVVNGVLGAILADTGYSFLSKKPISLSLPSKDEIVKEAKAEAKKEANK